jgi:hypothetical protein
VVFPEPEEPVIAMKVPGVSERVRPLSKVRFSILSPSSCVVRRGVGIDSKALRWGNEKSEVTDYGLKVF